MKKKLGIPKGTRDFDSIQLYKRNYIIDIIKESFFNFVSPELLIVALPLLFIGLLLNKKLALIKL